MYNDVLDIIINSVHEINQNLDDKLPVEQGVLCPLYGDAMALDSISLVSLIVTIEQRLEDQFRIPLILASEKAMSRRNSPFLTIGSLTNYVLECIKEEKND